jgi:hypothetical protein
MLKYCSIMLCLVSKTLKLGANSKTISDAKDKFRELTGKLLAVTNTIPIYTILSSLYLVPSRDQALEAAKLLLEVSDMLGNSHDGHQTTSLSKKRFQILKLLNVEYWRHNNVNTRLDG